MDDEDVQAESCKVVLLGESGVGKTSIISQLMEQEFNEDQGSTSGATFSTKTIFIEKFKKPICFEIWDTAGQEKYRSLTKMFYKDAAAAILVYDITRQTSFNELKNYWADQIKENAPKKIVVALAANKSDLYEAEEVDEESGRAFAKELGAIFKLTSCKNQTGIEDLFRDIGCKFLDPNADVSPEAEEEDQRLKANKRKSIKIVKKHETNPPPEEPAQAEPEASVNAPVEEEKPKKKKKCC